MRDERKVGESTADRVQAGRSHEVSAATRLDPSLVRGAMSGAARNSSAGEAFGPQLHVLVPAATDHPAALFGCARKSWFIIDRTPHSRAEKPSNHASEPPHVNS